MRIRLRERITLWDHFLIKSLWFAEPCFRVISIIYIKLVIRLEPFGIVTHNYTAYFSIKTSVDKTNNIF